jgi:arylsulfatase A
MPDSFDCLATVLGRADEKDPRDHLVMHNGGTQGPFAVRKGSWKLVQWPGPAAVTRNPIFAGIKDPAPGPLLFDLSKDPGENQDLAAKHPEKVKELQSLLKELRERGFSRAK